MDFATAVQAIKDRLGTTFSGLPVVHQGVSADRDPTQAWLLLEIVGPRSEQVSIGAPGAQRWRRYGVVMVHVFVPFTEADPDVTAWQKSDAVGGLFEGQQFSGISCWATSIGGGEKADEQGVWWRRSVTVPFYVDEIH